MSTNYYAVRNNPTIEEPIHIGKALNGLPFLLHEQNNRQRKIPVVWHSYREAFDWLEKWTVNDKQYVIINEYDEIVELVTLAYIIEKYGYELCDQEFS